MANLRYDPLAKEEIKLAAFYYESCREGLGNAFLFSIESSIQKVCLNPVRYRKISERFRRRLVEGFLMASSFQWRMMAFHCRSNAFKATAWLLEGTKRRAMIHSVPVHLQLLFIQAFYISANLGRRFFAVFAP
jgi:hypothetical protein